jgi:hypothetical protein
MEFKQEHLHELILSTVSDDYESLDLIEEQVNSWIDSARRVSRTEIAKTLEELEKKGEVTAYFLSPVAPHVESTFMNKANVEDLWFYATEIGRQKAIAIADAAELFKMKDE